MGNPLKRLKRNKLKRKETRARKNSPVVIHGQREYVSDDKITNSIFRYLDEGKI